MGNVAAFKARVTLESDQYIAGWKKVEAATTNSVSGMEKAISNGMKSWSKAMGKAVAGFLGIQLADTLVKSIDDTLKNPIFDNTGANIAYAVGDGFSKTLQSIPVAGTVGKWLSKGIGSAVDATNGLLLFGKGDYTGEMEEKQQASRGEAERNQRAVEVSQKLIANLEKQKQIASALNDQERARIERDQRFQEMATQMNDQMLKEGATGKQIQEARDRLRKAYEAVDAAQRATNDKLKKQLEIEQSIQATRARQRQGFEEEKQQRQTIADLDEQIFQAQERAANAQGKSLKPARDAVALAQERKERLEKIQDLEARISEIQHFKLEGTAVTLLTEEQRNAIIAEKLTLQAIVNNEKLIDQKQRQLEAMREQARVAQETQKAQEKAQAEAERRAEMRAAAEERHQDAVMGFMEDLQDALDERTMTEEQLFQKKMERMGLDEEEQAQAIALNNRLKAVESRDKLSSLSNVESISTAVGGVKMAGTTSGLDRLAKPAETTAKATQASAEHLRKMAAAAGAV